MGLVQLILSGIAMVINQKFFAQRLQGDYRLRFQYWTLLVALGSGTAFVYSTIALFMMTDAQVRGYLAAVYVVYGRMLHFEFSRNDLAPSQSVKMLEAHLKGQNYRCSQRLLMKLAFFQILYHNSSAVLCWHHTFALFARPIYRCEKWSLGFEVYYTPATKDVFENQVFAAMNPRMDKKCSRIIRKFVFNISDNSCTIHWPKGRFFLIFRVFERNHRKLLSKMRF